MTAESLAGILAQRVFGWRTRPDRFLIGDGREWVKREAFQPTESLDAAFRLLHAIKPIDYQLSGTGSGLCTAKVKLKGASGEATSHSLQMAVCLAVARALGIDVETID